MGEAKRRSGIELRIPVDEGKRILSDLGLPEVKGCERFIFALVGMSRTEGRAALLVRRTFSIPDEAYFAMPEGSAWAPRVTTEVLSEAMRFRAGVLLFHAHPGTSWPRLSGTDEASFQTLAAHGADLVPGSPHGSAVLGNSGRVGGFVRMPAGSTGEVREIDHVVWLGTPRRLVSRRPDGSRIKTDGRFDRLQPLVGESGLDAILRARVGVVGLCGGGSHVVQQLAHVGVRNLELVDDDVVELSNLTRMVGAKLTDVGRRKVDVMADLVRAVEPTALVGVTSEEFPSEAGIAALKKCDLVFSCVDGYAARSELMTFAWRHLIPIIDIGMAARPIGGKGPGAEWVRGHSCIYHPGGPCMWCIDQLSEAKLDAEREERARGYVRGMNAPQVVSFNGTLASMAVTEILQYLTGFMPAEAGPTGTGLLMLDGIRRSFEGVVPKRREDCRLCNFELGAGDPSP